MSRFTQQNMKVADIKIQESPTQISMTLTKLQEQIILQSRYNPFKDTGDSTNMFLLVNKQRSRLGPSSTTRIQIRGLSTMA